MRRTKQFYKGDHFYIKAGNKKEVHYIKKIKKIEYEYSKDLNEKYVNNFKIELKDKGFLIDFGNVIFGTDIFKSAIKIFLDYKVAKDLEKRLKEILK